MAVSDSEPGGYDVTFVDPLEKDLECPVCLCALREPLQTPCGHLMCKHCVDKLTEKEMFKCPVDNQVSARSEIFPDRVHERKILSLQVRCDNHTNGCLWTGELRFLEGHLGSEDCECGFVECHFSRMGCPEKMRKKEIQEHMKSHAEYHSLLLVHKIESLERDNNDLKAHLRGKSSSSCRFLWNITDWAKKLEDALSGRITRIYSEPFYSGYPGYKLVLALFPIGWGEAEGQAHYLGLSVYVRKGSYDDQLHWPFSMKYRIALIGHSGKNESRVVNAGSPEFQQAPGFQRPTEEKNKSGYGFSKFISITDLGSKGFIKDNSILIQVDVYP